MAQNTTSLNHGAPDEGKGGGGTVLGIIIGTVLAIMAVIMLPTTIVIMVGLVPSAVAFFVDSSREKLLGTTVLSLNVAGVLPAVLRLWKTGHHMENAISLISQPSVLIMVLIPSGMGWLLYIYMPQIASKLVRKRAESRIRSLEKQQKELIEQWSVAVTNGVPINPEEAPEKPKVESTEGSVTA